MAFAAAVAVVVGVAQTDIANAQNPPPLPMLFSGTVNAAGSPVPDGFQIVARVRDYESEPVVVANGRYTALTVGPPDSGYAGEIVTFHLDGVQGSQTVTFIAQGLPMIRTVNLSFLGLPTPTPTSTVLPPSPTPTPTPTSTATPRPPTPTPTPMPTPTPSVPPTATPTLTPTPVVALPSVYSGLIIVAGGSVPADAELVARVGGYDSLPASISGEFYRNLVINPGDTSLIGATLLFFLNGIESRTTDTYVSGRSSGDFDLVFVGVPTPTATPRPTETPIPPSPTATTPPPLEPTATPTPAGGGCFASVDAPVASGLANFLLMVAPLALIAGFRRYQRRELPGLDE